MFEIPDIKFLAIFLVLAVFARIRAKRKISPPGNPALRISDLSVSVPGGRRVLSGVNFQIFPGEVHALVGPNGSGKSSLALTILGDPQYSVESGSIENLLEFSASERANLCGVFVSWQSPVEVPGVTNFSMLHAAENARRREIGQIEISPFEFRKLCLSRISELGVTWLEPFLDAPVNEGLSGGERKKVELLCLCVLRPGRLVVLDEIDSGLDVDAVAAFKAGLANFKKAQPRTAFLLISHLSPLMPVSRVHVLVEGKISVSGGAELLTRVKRGGFESF